MILKHAQKRFKQRHGVTFNKEFQMRIFGWIRRDDSRVKYLGSGGNNRSKYNIKLGNRHIPIVVADDADVVITALSLGKR